MSAKDEKAMAALQRRKRVSRPLTAAAAAAPAPEAAAAVEAPPSAAFESPAAAPTPAAPRSSKSKPAPRTNPKRPAGTRRVTLDADAAALDAFQERLDSHGWTQRAGLTAAVTLFNGLGDDEFDRLCRTAQIEARRR